MVLAQKQTHGLMEQNRDPRKPMSINVQQRRQEYTIDSLFKKSTGKTGQLHVK